MQKWAALVILLAALVFHPVVASAQSLKIGTVNMKKIMQAYDRTEEMRAAVNEVLKTNQRELQEHFDSTKKSLEETKSLDRELTAADLSPQARAQKLKLREEQVGALHNSEAKQRQLKQTGDIRMRERLSRKRAGVVDEVNGIVAREARENDYAIVLDTSGTSTPGWPTVLYSRETFDFTDRVISALQKLKGWEK